MTPIFFGLLAALSWGASDFAGGLSSRRVGAYVAVFYAELIGLAALVATIPFFHETLPPLNDLLICLAAGAIGTFSLILFYHAMANGQMSIAAPVSALLAIILPIVIGSFTEGLPGAIQILGFVFALLSVWLITKVEADNRPHVERLADLRLPVLAGLGFGLYFVFIHQGSRQGVIWPMVASRLGGTILMLIFAFIRRDMKLIGHRAWWIITLNALLDVGGNLFYILAGQAGRLDVVTVISALYPAGTVFLAWLFLKERLGRPQVVGILTALLSITLMSL